MAKATTRESIFDVLINSTNGFTFGTPKRVDEKSLAVVLPIIRHTSLARHYITFPETEKVLVFDTGKIDEMEVQNNDERNVFVRSGTIFKGATQTRALQRSAVLFPGKKSKINVRCIYASKGIRHGSQVQYGGITPLDFAKAVYDHGYTPKDQSSYWHSAGNTTSKLAALSGKVPLNANAGIVRSAGLRRRAQWMSGAAGMSYSTDATDDVFNMAHFAATTMSDAGALPPQDDLASNLDSFAIDFEKLLTKVKRIDNQAGLALITDKGVQTIEIFDHADSWKALHESAVKSLGSDIAGKEDAENLFDYKPEVAVQKVKKVLGQDWKQNRILEIKPDNGSPAVDIFGVTAGDYVGEIVEIDGRVIHLVILKKEAA